MFLQTCIYYFAQAVADLCSENCNSEALLYGTEQLRKLCAEWKTFFAPTMLAGLGAHLDTDELPCWEAVMSTADCISFIENQCNDVMAAHRAGKETVRSWHLMLLLDFIVEVAEHCFEGVWYDNPGIAKCIYFDKTDRYLTSFVPIETSVSPLLIPAAYTPAEQCVAGIYVRSLSHAPSFVEASGVDSDDQPKFIWVSGGQLSPSARSTWEELIAVGSTDDAFAIIDGICRQWERELAHQK